MHCLKMIGNITAENSQTMHILPIWLVALCPRKKAVDMLGLRNFPFAAFT